MKILRDEQYQKSKIIEMTTNSTHTICSGSPADITFTGKRLRIDKEQKDRHDKVQLCLFPTGLFAGKRVCSNS
jgi:hypothetical protein